MKILVRWLIIILLGVYSTLALGQSTRLVQVKLLNKSMQPKPNLAFSFDNLKRYTSNDNGQAVVKMSDDELPPKDVYIYDKTLEAESWNYSKGVLEIIIRTRTTKTIKGIVKNAFNEPIPNLAVVIGEVNQRRTKTNAYGEFEFKVPLDFKINVKSAYKFDGYTIENLQADNDYLRFVVDKIEQSTPATAVAAEPIPTIDDQPPQLVDSATADIAAFYNYLKGISLEDLNEEQQQELNNIFYELVTYYEDSLKKNIYNKFQGISESSKIEDDLTYLIERAKIEQNIASEFNRIFAEKIGIINKKLAEGGEELTPDERQTLLADIELLDQILRKNESLFKENQADYREMLRSISTNLLQISDLEEQLDLSEQQRKEQQQTYEQRVLFYSVVLGLLVVFLVVLAYFLARIKKQKDKTQKAYQKINELNEHLEELVEERTAMLEMTNAELDTFFYKSAHNLRRPLLTIVGLSEIAKLTLDEEARKLFAKATETASSMDTMLKKLIMVSHINYPEEKGVVDFEGIVNKITTDFNPKDYNVSFKKLIHSQSFVSHPLLIDIVLRNLLENAFEFSSFANKHPRVDLEITESKEGLEITVSDNGQGIDASQEEKMWRMFYVANENSSGNGLGLYIAQKAVKTLNGTIKYTRIDNITQFKVIIPKSHKQNLNN